MTTSALFINFEAQYWAGYTVARSLYSLSATSSPKFGHNFLNYKKFRPLLNKCPKMPVLPIELFTIGNGNQL
jgi:hypothetical protein